GVWAKFGLALWSFLVHLGFVQLILKLVYGLRSCSNTLVTAGSRTPPRHHSSSSIATIDNMRTSGTVQ
ncbi:hypothetical protein HAX54_012583, partial [Datura stramonium]|nr:hypothetical protein [Datura stramonium]